MLISLLGWFWVIMGVIFFVKPDLLRKRLQRKTTKKLKKYLFVIALTLSILLIAAAWKTEGILSKIVMILGIIGIFKALFLLKAKAADRIIEWYTNQSLTFFRLGACIQIIIGIIILVLRK